MILLFFSFSNHCPKKSWGGDISPETAATQLIDAVLSIEWESFRYAVGRALRRLEPGGVSRLLVERMSGLVSERKAAGDIAGWLPTSEISNALDGLADRDNANEVRYAALSALDRHRDERSVRALLAAFPTGTLGVCRELAPSNQESTTYEPSLVCKLLILGCRILIPDRLLERRWSLLVAILEAGDAHLLTDGEDLLWLGKVLSDDIPAAFEHHANSVLLQRKQQED